MMGLMVEDVGNRPPQWTFVLLAAAHVNERDGEPLRGESSDPGRELVVGKFSLPAEVLEVDEEFLVEGTDTSGLGFGIANGFGCGPPPSRTSRGLSLSFESAPPGMSAILGA
jgi:hypothetical protein